MARFKHGYLDAGPTLRAIDRANDRDKYKHIGIGNVPGLKYSSPRPWALALGISLSMWTGIFWVVRLFV